MGRKDSPTITVRFGGGSMSIVATIDTKAGFKPNASQLRQKLNKSNKIAHLISRWAILL